MLGIFNFSLWKMTLKGGIISPEVFRISLSQSQHFMNAQKGRKDSGNEVVKRTLTLRKRKDLGPDHEALLSYNLS